ncbi:hypothetical protein AYO22_02342 [Fonsecaea multimorphosa]|nr:hypothetical protein AYO22_02342 [Fonsecaea multimorphosa]
MATPSSPVREVAVVGGTGTLGSSVAISLAKNPAFGVRALSRDAQGPKAQSLWDCGITVETANNWDSQALEAAFHGCWAVFINIDSDNPDYQWKTGAKPTEFDMTKNVMDSAIRAGVKHIIFASLPPASNLTQGKMPMVSFDDKARAADYMMECAKMGQLETATVVNPGWFLENAYDDKYVAAFGGFAKLVDGDGYLTFKTPRMGNDPESVPWLAVADDYGDIVHGILLECERWNGEYIDAVSESTSFADMAAAHQKATGRLSRFIAIEKGALEAEDASKTEEVNGLYDLMHELKGNFFNGRPTEHENAKALKAKACEATGRGDQACLMTVEGFFRKYGEPLDS